MKQISDKMRRLGLSSQESMEAPEAVEEGGADGGLIEGMNLIQHEEVNCIVYEGELYDTITYYRLLGGK
jgi:prolyl oligopeptidase PreP (S9A serine peptidase family)